MPSSASAVPRQLDAVHPLAGLVVVLGRHVHEAHAPGPQGPHRGDDVGGVQGDVLHAGGAVEVEVLLDLALPAALGRLVDRQHDLVVVPHHRRHQRRVLGGDLVVVEVGELVEAEHLLVVADPLARGGPARRWPTTWSNRVMPTSGPTGRREVGRLELRGERARVGRPVEERVHGVAVGADGGVVDRRRGRPRPWPARAATWRRGRGRRRRRPATSSTRKQMSRMPSPWRADVLGDGAVGVRARRTP